MSLCPLRASLRSAAGAASAAEYRAAPLHLIPSRRRHWGRATSARGGADRLASAPHHPRGGPARRPPSPPAEERRDEVQEAVAETGRVPRAAPRRGAVAGFPPRAEWYGLLGNPLTQISLYGIHPVRGGVTDGKRSRLQPSAAGSARDGTRRDAAAPPHPLPTSTRGETPPGPRRNNIAPAGAVPPQVTPSRGGRRHRSSVGPPRNPAAEEGAAKEAAKQGRRPGPAAGRVGWRALCTSSKTLSRAKSGVCPRLGTGTQQALPAESLTYPLCCGEEGVMLIWHC